MSSIDLIAAYLVERGRPTVFIPLAVLIAETAWLVAPVADRTVVGFGVCAAQALVLVFAFRVWDDLQDRARDAVHHTDRITVRAPRVGPLIALGLSLAVGAAVSLLAATVPLVRIAIIVTIVLALFAWYRARPRDPSRLSSAVPLAKYPAIAIALAPGLGEVSPLRAAAAAGSLYLIAFTYEYLEDRHRGIA